MNIPTWAGFVARLPDDEVATGQEIAVFGGRNVAVALGEILAGLGCNDISEPRYGGEVGWDFKFRYGEGHSFWCRAQSFHPIYWLLLDGPSGRRGAEAHLELWRKFSDALEADPRFEQVLWRSEKEGPPDWGEFTLTDDLPPRRILKELPPRNVMPKPVAAGGPRVGVIVAAWFVLTMIALQIIDSTVHGARAQSTYSGLAMAAVIVGLAIVLRVIDRRRKAAQSRAEIPGSAP